MMVESAELNDKIFVRLFVVFCVSVVTVDCHFASEVHHNTRYPSCMKLFISTSNLSPVLCYPSRL